MKPVTPPKAEDPSRIENSEAAKMPDLENTSNLTVPETPPKAPSGSKAVESIFELALKSKSDAAANTAARVVKAPSRIKPTKRIKGWFRTHPTVLIGPIDIFDPKDEGILSDEPTFILPELAEELRMESTAFENAIHEVVCYLVATKGGALYLFLAPVPDPTTGRHHSAIEQKIDAVEAARTKWKRLEWSKTDKQYDDYTAEGEIYEPKWPEDVSAASILNRAFGERNVIKHRDDPLIVKIRGEA